MFVRITKTELKVIKLLLFTNPQIAEILVCSVATVKTFVHQLMRKFNASTRAEIILKALRNRVIFIDDVCFPNDLDLDEWYAVKGEDYYDDKRLVGQVSDEDAETYKECKRVRKKVRTRIS